MNWYSVSSALTMPSGSDMEGGSEPFHDSTGDRFGKEQGSVCLLWPRQLIGEDGRHGFCGRIRKAGGDAWLHKAWLARRRGNEGEKEPEWLRMALKTQDSRSPGQQAVLSVSRMKLQGKATGVSSLTFECSRCNLPPGTGKNLGPSLAAESMFYLHIPRPGVTRPGSPLVGPHARS
jgi:hypothetical protein